MTPSNTRGDGGFGLLLVVVLLAVMGMMVLTSFGVARREFRAATDLASASRAFEAAEAGLAAAEAVAGGFAGAPVLVPQSGPAVATPRSRFSTTILRLDSSLLLLTAVGEGLDGAAGVLASRRLGAVGKVIPAVGSVPARFERLPAWGWVQLYR